MSYSPSVARELWSRGLPLDEAADRAAPRQLHDQLKKPFPTLDQTAAKAIPVDAGWIERVVALTVAVKPVVEHFQDRATLCAEMRDNLLMNIEDGALIALGYALPRKFDDFPNEIPIDIWEGNIDWLNSSVCGNGLEFSAVRIASRKWLAKSHEQIAPLQIPLLAVEPLEAVPRNPGRPNLRNEIWIAYEKLKHEQGIQFNQPMTRSYDRIRATVKLLFPEQIDGDRMLGDEAIRKVTFEDFRKESDTLARSSKL